jgi:hypothetical protein
MDVRHRKRHLKPKPASSAISRHRCGDHPFMLLLVYALGSGRTRSYAFVADLYDISNDFNESRPDSIGRQDRIRPGYNTDLGNSLPPSRANNGHGRSPHHRGHPGDGRSNYNDLICCATEDAKRRARLVCSASTPVGTGDNDMLSMCAVRHGASGQQPAPAGGCVTAVHAAMPGGCHTGTQTITIWQTLWHFYCTVQGAIFPLYPSCEPEAPSSVLFA